MDSTKNQTTRTGLPKHVSLDAVAEAASISRETVRRMIARGELPAVRIGGQLRVRVSDALELLRVG